MPVEITGSPTIINTADSTGTQEVFCPADASGVVTFFGGFETGTDTSFGPGEFTLTLGGQNIVNTGYRNEGNSLENDIFGTFSTAVYKGQTKTLSWSFENSITNGYLVCLVFVRSVKTTGYTSYSSYNTGDASTYSQSAGGSPDGRLWIIGVVSNTTPVVNGNGQTEVVVFGPCAKGGGKYMGIGCKYFIPNAASSIEATSLSYPGGVIIVLSDALTAPAAWLTA